MFNLRKILYKKINKKNEKIKEYKSVILFLNIKLSKYTKFIYIYYASYFIFRFIFGFFTFFQCFRFFIASLIDNIHIKKLYHP